MTPAFLFFALIPTIFALNVDHDALNGLRELDTLMRNGKTRIEEALAAIKKAREVNEVIVEERTNALIHTYHHLYDEVHDTLKGTVLKGMTTKKLLEKYTCISNVGHETFKKLNATFNQIAPAAEELQDKGVSVLYQYIPILTGLHDYVVDLENLKTKAELGAKSHDGVDNIFGDVPDKMKVIEDLTLEVSAKIDEAKFKFFENYVDYMYEMEKKFKKDHRAGITGIGKCLN